MCELLQKLKHGQCWNLHWQADEIHVPGVPLNSQWSCQGNHYICSKLLPEEKTGRQRHLKNTVKKERGLWANKKEYLVAEGEPRWWETHKRPCALYLHGKRREKNRHQWQRQWGDMCGVTTLPTRPSISITTWVKILITRVDWLTLIDQYQPSVFPRQQIQEKKKSTFSASKLLCFSQWPYSLLSLELCSLGSAVTRPAVSSSFVNLWEMQILRPHPRPTESETLGWSSALWVLISFCSLFQMHVKIWKPFV